MSSNSVNRKVEDRVIASSQAELAPEYRMAIVQQCEFRSEFATSYVTIELPFGQTVELSERRQLVVLLGLLQRALPAVRRVENRLDGDWKDWLNRLDEFQRSGDSGSS